MGSVAVTDGWVHGRDSEFRTPPWLVGNCSTIWTSVPGYYKLPYQVQFGRFGRWTWKSPLAQGGGAELGEGMFMSAPVVQQWPNGSWAATAHDTSRYSPGGTTVCCCMYVGAHGSGAPIVLSEYCNASVQGTVTETMAEVCTKDDPFFKPCPESNATLREKFGDPFIEVYSSCIDESNAAADGEVGLAGRMPAPEQSPPLGQCFSLFSVISMVVGFMCFWARWFCAPHTSEHVGGSAYLRIEA